MDAVRGRRRRAWAAFAAALVALTAITACGTIGMHRAAAPRGARPQTGYQAVIARLLPSVVEISPGRSTGSGRPAGSGVVFDGRGDIVTNAQVVGKAKDFTVAAAAVASGLNATLVGVFAPDDLAVIRVTSGASNLRAARWADSSQAQVGEIVLAMGSPYGLLDSITQGIVSATGRTVSGPPRANGEPRPVISGAIQTSAAINPGNNGGALVTLAGGVLGIPALAARNAGLGFAAPGIGFAIPANTVTDIAAQLIARGKVTVSGRSSLQITGRTHVDSSGKPDGVTVAEAPSGGAAAQAGIAAGDVIAGLDGQQIRTLAQMENQLTRYQPDEKVSVEILRDGNPRQFHVTLGALTS